MAFWRVSLSVMVAALTAVQACQEHPECPPLWSRYGVNCYRFFGQTKTWQAAEEHCQQFFSQSGQGHLASIHSQDEENLLRILSRTSIATADASVWLGATDEEVEAEYRWADGTELDYQDWLPNQPSNFNSRRQQENCLVLWFVNSQVGWNDGVCSREYAYICKMPASQ